MDSIYLCVHFSAAHNLIATFQELFMHVSETEIEMLSSFRPHAYMRQNLLPEAKTTASHSRSVSHSQLAH